MKKWSFTTALFLFLLLTPNAQFYLGPLAGISFSDFRLEGETDNSLKWGAGLVVQYYVADNMSLLAQPMYIQKGAGIKPNDDTPKLDASLSFIEVPLLFRYEFGESEKVYVMGGPVFSYLLTSDLQAELNRIKFEADLKDLTEKFEISLSAGAGISVPVSFGKFFIESRYTYGLTNLAKTGEFIATAGEFEAQGALDEDDGYETLGLNVIIGVMFRL